MAVTGEVFGIAKMTAALDAITSKVRISWLRWVGATTAGHALSVTDTAGNVIWESEADGANFIDMFPVYKIVTGVKAATMDSGTLYVYIM